MLPTDREWVRRFLAVRMERARAAHDLTQQLLRRSHEQIVKSETLLQIEIPWVWHPEPSKEQQSRIVRDFIAPE